MAVGWYWVGLKKGVAEHVACCEVCQRSKASSLSLMGLLQPLPIPKQIWEDISMNFVEGLPVSEGYDTLLVVVDQLSKYAIFLTYSYDFTSTAHHVS